MTGKKKIKKIRILLWIGIILMFVFVSLRIYYVNQNARLPEVRRISQGTGVIYKGIEYKIIHAEMWGYSEFFDSHTGLCEFENTERDSTDTKILVVECQVNVEEDNNYLAIDVPVQYGYLFNEVDPFMWDAMNASEDGIFHSGDTLIYAYEIYRENMKESQWEQVKDMKVEYAMVFGCYPVKNELLITEIEEKKGVKEEKNESGSEN